MVIDRQIELERKDAKSDGIEQGIGLGIGKGEVIKLITQTCKKKRKGIRCTSISNNKLLIF